MSASCNSGCGLDPGPAGKAGLLLGRLLLAMVFLFSGAAKLGWLPGFGDPTGFASAVVKFEVIHPDLVPLATFVIPWLEVVCGGALLLGFMSRGAGRTLGVLTLVFTAAMVAVMVRGMEVDCSCFGGALRERFGPAIGEWLEPEVGWKSLVRNAILFGLLVFVSMGGPGFLAIDGLFVRSNPTSEEQPA